MAYRRTICTRATLFARSRFNPSLSYISHDRDDNKKGNEEGNFRKFDDFSSQIRGFGTYLSNLSGPGFVFQQQSVGFGGIGNGVGGHRYMSTSIGEGVDKAEYFTDVAEVFTSGPVEAIASHAPVMSEVAIAAADSAFPVAALQYLIDYVHTFTGLSWAVSIALTTLLIRGATVPFLINQLKSTSKLSIMRPRLEEIKAEMDAKGDDPTAMQDGQAKMNALFKEYGVTPFTPLKGMLIQGPIFISFFLAIRNMAEKVPSFKNGGAFWFTDLTTPDAMYIFPVLTAVTFLITVEFNMQEGLEGNPIAGTMKKFSRGLAVLTVPFTMSFPKAIFCYWVTANIFSLAYGAVLKLPGVKQTLGVPDIPMPPPSQTQPGTKPGFSLLEALKQASASGRSTATPSIPPTPAVPATPAVPVPATPATAEQQNPAVRGRTSSAAILSQRIKSLERQVKQRKKARK